MSHDNFTSPLPERVIAHAPPTSDVVRSCSPSPVRCFTGVQSLCLIVPPGLTGGAFVDAPAKKGWLYVAKARVFHEEAPGSTNETKQEQQPEVSATRLVLWDMRDGKEASAPATKRGEWEVRKRCDSGRRGDFCIFFFFVQGGGGVGKLYTHRSVPKYKEHLDYILTYKICFYSGRSGTRDGGGAGLAFFSCRRGLDFFSCFHAAGD